MADRSPTCWYRLRSGVLYHAVGDAPAGATPVSAEQLEQLIAAGESDFSEWPEVAGDELGPDSAETDGIPRNLDALAGLGEASADDQIDAPEGS